MEEVKLWTSIAKPPTTCCQNSSLLGVLHTLNCASPVCCCPNMLSWWHIVTEYFDPTDGRLPASTYCHLFCPFQNLCIKMTSGHSLPDVNTEYFYGLLEYDAM